MPWAGRDVTEASAAATVAAFHRLHERLYTFAQEDTPVEIVTLRVDARGVFPAPALRELPPAGPLEDARMRDRRPCYLEAGPAEAAIYARERLGAGARIDGPAILTQLDATTLLLPGPGRHRRPLRQPDRRGIRLRAVWQRDGVLGGGRRRTFPIGNISAEASELFLIGNFPASASSIVPDR